MAQKHPHTHTHARALTEAPMLSEATSATWAMFLAKDVDLALRSRRFVHGVAMEKDTPMRRLNKPKNLQA